MRKKLLIMAVLSFIVVSLFGCTSSNDVHLYTDGNLVAEKNKIKYTFSEITFPNDYYESSYDQIKITIKIENNTKKQFIVNKKDIIIYSEKSKVEETFYINRGNEDKGESEVFVSPGLSKEIKLNGVASKKKENHILKINGIALFLYPKKLGKVTKIEYHQDEQTFYQDAIIGASWEPYEYVDPSKTKYNMRWYMDEQGKNEMYDFKQVEENMVLYSVYELLEIYYSTYGTNYLGPSKYVITSINYCPPSGIIVLPINMLVDDVNLQMYGLSVNLDYWFDYNNVYSRLNTFYVPKEYEYFKCEKNGINIYFEGNSSQWSAINNSSGVAFNMHFNQTMPNS